jgi:carbonic anhydrase
MKINLLKNSLGLFILFCISLSLTSNLTSKMSKNEKTLVSKEKLLAELKTNISGYFFIQILYTSNDPLTIISKSQQSMSLKYIMLNDKILAITPSQEKKSDIEDTISLDKLFDKSSDNIAKGKCCKNVVLREFKGCQGNCPKRSSPNVPNEISSNFCVDIHTNTGNMFRICSDNISEITKLQTQINYNIIKLNSKNKIDQKVLEKFMINLSTNTKNNESMKKWHWDDQKQWEGFCNDNNQLQSPIDIETSKVSGVKEKEEINFGINYHFEDILTSIRKNNNQMLVHFLNYAGLLKFFVGNVNLVFQPQYLSFRFPGEHTIDGKRYPGEVLIHFTELNPNLKTWVTNGLVLSIPLNPSGKNLSLDFFENLNPDFWRLETKKSSEYQPKDLKSKKPLKFSLQDLVKKAVMKKPKYYTYVGSETTPNCKPKIIYLVIDKPMDISNCQFKVLRENSLLTDRVKEIHARNTQELKDRKVYEIKYKDTPAVKAHLEVAKKQFKPYNKIIKKQVMQTCGSKAKPMSPAVIKTPLQPKSIKALKKEIKEKKKKILKMNGPEKKEAIKAFKKEQKLVENCDIK